MPVAQTLDSKVIVRIDKKLQAQKREKVGNFYVPEHMMDFSNNLQFGEIISFGDDAKKVIPEIEIGDIAIFDHSIEFKVVSTDKRDDEAASMEEDMFLVEVEENGDEIRYIPTSLGVTNKLFGIFKNDKIIPSRGMVFCSIEAKITEFQLVNGVYINSEESKQPIIDALELASHARKEYSNAYSKIEKTEKHAELLEELSTLLSKIENEIESLTQRLNRTEVAEVTILHKNELDKIDINTGDVALVDEKMIYPIDLFGSRFIIIRNIKWLIAKKFNTLNMKKNKLAIGPLLNRVIIKLDEPKKETSAGIYIPDSAKEKEPTGRVVAVGPGYSEEFPMKLKVGDRILYEKFKGTELVIDKEKYLALMDVDIICTLDDHMKASIGFLSAT